MKNSIAGPTSLLAGCFFAVFALTAQAATFAVVTNATPYTALDDAIAPNLIQNGQSSLASVTYSGTSQSGFPESALNDGSAAGSGNMTYYNGGNLPQTVTFNLNTNNGTGGSTNGYDISAVQCISGWQDSYFANQNFQVLFSINGGAFSVAYGSYVGTSSLGGGNNCVMTTVTNDSGPIARNVTAIKYQFLTPAANSQMVIHELQAFGTPSAAAGPAPTIVAIATNGTSYNALDGLIVNNLLRTGQSSLGSVVTSHNPFSGWTDASLNDGAGNATAGNSAGLVFYPSPGTAGGLPVTMTFNLNTNNGTGGSATGYDLSSVQAISGWADSYFADQNFQLLLSTNGGPFFDYGRFIGSCALNGGNNSMMTTVTNLAGLIAKNVTAIQLVFSRSATGNGGIVIRELQAFGTPSSAAGPVPTVVATQQSSTAANTYDGSVAVNLITTGQQSLAGVYASGSASTALGPTSALNDGSTAGNGNLTFFYGGDGVLPATITYYLNTASGTGSPNGYNITNVQAISGWSDSYFADQKFQLLFSINGGAFQDYGTYSSYNNLNGSSAVSVSETVGRSGGWLATNVTAVQFVLQNPGGHDITTANSHYAGTVYRELQVFGSPVTTVVPAPVLVSDTLPATAANVVGDQVVFTATFGNAPAAVYQWQKISGGVTNDITDATNTTLTLNNLQLTDTASYRLKAINATNSAGVTFGTARPLTVSSVPAPVNNVITKLAAQTGLGPADVLGITFTPTWPVTTNDSLIAGQLPSSAGGNFSLELPGRSVTSLTAGGSSALSVVTATVGYTTSTNYVTCGNGGGAGSSIIYTLTNTSASGYDLTNITVYGGWADAGRDQQAYTVSYSTAVNPTTFISLGSVNYNPANAGNVESATRATLVAVSGALATNVAAVKFDFTSPASENGYCGYSQIALFGAVSAPLPVTINLSHFPRPMQVYPRNLATGFADVLVDGLVTSTGCTQIAVSVLRNGLPYTNLTQSLTYSGGTAPFSISASIFAELASYDFAVYVTKEGTNYLVASADDVVAGDVYLINGQSNAEAMMFAGSANGNTNRYLRSFGTRDDSGTTVAADLNWHLADGDLLYGPGAVGQWGLRLGRLILDTDGIPVAIINGARGGWPISSFQRNDAFRQDLNTDYGRTLFRATQAGVQNNIRAILWYQGESDNGDADAHQKGWITLHDNWLQDYPSVEKFYIFQLHVGCGVDQFNTDLRNRQRLLADQFGDVEVMSTTAVGNTVGDCHYPYSGGYETHATNIFRLVQRDLYGAAPQNNIEPPNPYYAYFSAPTHDQITLIMRNPGDALSFATGAQADFRLEGSAVTVAAGLAIGDTLVLTLSGDASAATGISYGGHIGAAAPAIVNANGVGLLAFYNLPIQSSLGAPGVPAWVASAAISSDRIDITWAAATNAAEYLIRRDGTVIGKTTGMVFTDQTVAPGPLYNYQIAAVSTVSTSAWSSVTSATTVPNNVFAFVPEATNFTVLYQLDIPNDLRLGSTLTAPYDVDNSDVMTKPFDRVAYYLELQTDPGQPLNWVYLSCDPFSFNPKLLGVPALAAGGIFHQPITNLNVYASAGAGVATGQGLGVGNIEFWGWNYETANGYGVAGASDATYDSGDIIQTGGTYGSMQIHRANQTLIGYNGWGAYTADSGSQSSDDLGIGSQPAAQPDWTFAANSFRYTYKRMYVLVRPVTPAALACTSDGTHLQLSWPAANTGWRLQAQTNTSSAGLGTNWVTISGSLTTNKLTLPISSAEGCVFFRLVYP